MAKTVTRIGGRWTQDEKGALESAQYEERTVITDDETGEVLADRRQFTMGFPASDLARMFGAGGSLAVRVQELEKQIVDERKASEAALAAVNAELVASRKETADAQRVIETIRKAEAGWSAVVTPLLGE